MKLLLLSLFFCGLTLNSYASFEHLGEASVVVSGGNSKIQTYNVKSTNSYKHERYTVTFGGHYTLGNAGQIVVARNWDANTKADTKFTKTLGAFVGENIAGDRFTGYETRLSTDVGLSDELYQSDTQELKGELGYRYFYEKNIKASIGSKNNNMGRVNMFYRYTRKDRYVVEAYLEYLPNFSESVDYLVNFGPSIAFSLNSFFSLKLSYDGKYDNQPAIVGNPKLNYLYTTSLISKF